MSTKLKTIVALVVTAVFAASFVVGALTKDYTPFLAVVGIMGLLVGAGFGVKHGP